MPAPRQVLETILLVVAIVFQAAAIYGIADATTRMIVGALSLAVIMAITVRLAKIEVKSEPAERWVPSKRYQKRRYHRLRKSLERFIEDVRLLNRVSVDIQRGFRSRESAEVEIQQIESRMANLVKELRAAAAVESEEG